MGFVLATLSTLPATSAHETFSPVDLSLDAMSLPTTSTFLLNVAYVVIPQFEKTGGELFRRGFYFPEKDKRLLQAA